MGNEAGAIRKAVRVSAAFRMVAVLACAMIVSAFAASTAFAAAPLSAASGNVLEAQEAQGLSAQAGTLSLDIDPASTNISLKPGATLALKVDLVAGGESVMGEIGCWSADANVASAVIPRSASANQSARYLYITAVSAGTTTIDLVGDPNDVSTYGTCRTTLNVTVSPNGAKADIKYASFDLVYSSGGNYYSGQPKSTDTVKKLYFGNSGDPISEISSDAFDLVYFSDRERTKEAGVGGVVNAGTYYYSARAKADNALYTGTTDLYGSYTIQKTWRSLKIDDFELTVWSPASHDLTLDLASDAAGKAFPIVNISDFDGIEVESADESIVEARVAGTNLMLVPKKVTDKAVNVNVRGKDSVNVNGDGGTLVVTVVDSTPQPEPKTMLVSAEDVSAAYDGLPHALAPVAKDAETGEALDAAILYKSGDEWTRDAPTLVDAGTMTVTFKAEAVEGYAESAEATATVTVTAADSTEADGESGVSASGSVFAELSKGGKIVEMDAQDLGASGDAADKERLAELTDKYYDEGKVEYFQVYSVTLSLLNAGTGAVEQEITEGFGELEISLPIDEKYNGQTAHVVELHGQGDEEIDLGDHVVENGAVTVEVDKLSDFVVTIGKQDADSGSGTGSGSGAGSGGDSSDTGSGDDTGSGGDTGSGSGSGGTDDTGSGGSGDAGDTGNAGETGGSTSGGDTSTGGSESGSTGNTGDSGTGTTGTGSSGSDTSSTGSSGSSTTDNSSSSGTKSSTKSSTRANTSSGSGSGSSGSSGSGSSGSGSSGSSASSGAADASQGRAVPQTGDGLGSACLIASLSGLISFAVVYLAARRRRLS